MIGAPPPTPLAWKWKWLSRKNTIWNYVGQARRPLVVTFPPAPSESSSEMGDYLARLFYDDGYSLGILGWKDGRARDQSVRQDVEEVFSEFGEIRGNPQRLGGFDPNRIVIMGGGDAAFPGALVAFNSGPRGNSPVCAAIFFNAENLDTTQPESVISKHKFAADARSADLSPMRFAANAPPTLLMTEAMDSNSIRRSDALADAIRSSGGVAVRASYARFRASDATTYVGYSESPATKIISDFLSQYCPARDTSAPRDP